MGAAKGMKQMSRDHLQMTPTPMLSGNPRGVLEGSSPCWEDEEPKTQSEGGGFSATAVSQWLEFKTRPDSKIHPTLLPAPELFKPTPSWLEQDLSFSLEASGHTSRAQVATDMQRMKG